MSRLKANLFLVSGFVGFFTAALFLQYYQSSQLRGRSEWYHDWLYLPSSEYVKLTSLGYDQITADFLWLRSIQAFGAAFAGLGTLDQMESYFDVTTDLDPKFMAVYAFANLVIGEEAGRHEAGLRILDKGILHNPRRYRLPFEAAFFSYWEMDEPERAKYYTRLALKSPDCPAFVRGWVGYFDMRMGRYIAGMENYLKDYAVYSNNGNEPLRHVRWQTMRRVIDEWYTAELHAKSVEFNERHGKFPTSVEELEKDGAFIDSELPFWPALMELLERLEASGEEIPSDHESISAMMKSVMRKGWTKFPPCPISDNPNFPGYIFWPGHDAFVELEGVMEPNKYFVISEIAAVHEIASAIMVLDEYTSQWLASHNNECPTEVAGKDPVSYLNEFIEPWGGEWVWDPERCTLYPSTRPDLLEKYKQAPKLL